MGKHGEVSVRNIREIGSWAHRKMGDSQMGVDGEMGRGNINIRQRGNRYFDG